MKAQNVLLIENNRANRTVHAAALSSFGYQVMEAQSPTEAHQHLQAGANPDIVYVDLRRNDDHDQELVAAIRQLLPEGQVKIVVAAPQPSSAMLADAFLPKPVDLDVLLNTLQNFQM